MFKRMKEINDLYNQIKGDASGLEQFLAKLPGLAGYMEREQRRAADMLLRQTVSARLEETRLALGEVHQALNHDIVLAITYAEPLGRVDTKLMGLIGKIHDAPVGYAGFFDAVKVQEAELAQLYIFDEQMVQHAEQLALDVAALAKAAREDGEIAQAIAVLNSNLTAANDAFIGRNALLLGVE
jgi:hypothetical protein